MEATEVNFHNIFSKGQVIMARVFNNDSATDATIRAIDRKREQERRFMLSQVFKNAEELSTRLVQRLIDKHIIETTSEQAMRDLFSDLTFKQIKPLSIRIKSPFLTIRGNSKSETILDGNRATRIFNADMDGQLRIENLTLRNGNSTEPFRTLLLAFGSILC